MAYPQLFLKLKQVLILAFVSIVAISPLESDAQQLSSLCNNVSCPDSFIVSNDPVICPRVDQIRAGLLYDVNRNEIVFHKKLNGSYPIASVTKMMVALIVAEEVSSGKRSWNEEVKFSLRVRKSRRSRTYVTRWYTYTLNDLLKSTLIASNNTSAREISRHVAGSIDAFVTRMNAKAKELGMNSTQYSNPSGLPARRAADDNKSSPHDLLKLTLTFMQYPDLMEITGMHYSDIKVNGRTSRLVNTNKLVADHQVEFLGIKTGYINRAGHCLVAAANVDSTYLITITLGVNGSARRNSIIQEMMNNYYYDIGECRLGEEERNPAFVRAISSGSIKLPAEERNDYKTVYKGAKTVYKVRRGDNLSKIGQRFGCSVSQLKRWNKLRSTRIYAGQRLYVNTLVKSLEFTPGWMEGATASVSGTAPVTNTSTSAKASTGKTETLSKTLTSNNSVSATKHKVLAGENLSQLATIYGCSVRQIMNWNGLSNTKIRSGQYLVVSAGSKNTIREKEITHTVRRGETLSGIANRYGMSVTAIKQQNKLSSTVIKVGQRLSIAQTFAGEIPVEKQVHTVRSGETLSELAERYSCSISQLRSWNNISGSNIKIGQKIVIYNSDKVHSQKIAANKKEYMIYEVRSGDTLWDIARKFNGNSVGSIKKLNNIRSGRNLKPGMKLKIEIAS